VAFGLLVVSLALAGAEAGRFAGDGGVDLRRLARHAGHVLRRGGPVLAEGVAQEQPRQERDSE
jgi:hypothetical protein